jgi:GT2 family glycosyltransferase
VIVSWNTRDLLAGCLESLEKYVDPEVDLDIVVVDNGSKDGTLEMLGSEWPLVRVIANAENMGYQRASNQAFAECGSADMLLLINADALLTPDCLRVMLRCMQLDPRAAAVGPRLVYGDGRWQRWTAGRAPSLRAAAAYYLFLERLFPGVEWFEGLFLGQDVRTARHVEWVSSACMLVRRVALDEIGPMDERFFAYMDDVDLCVRFRATGWHVWYSPEATAVHFMGQSTRRQTGTVSPLALRSFNRYFLIHRGRVPTLALKGIEALGFALRTAAYLGVSVARGREGARLRAQARAHWSYCKVSLEG